jgi:hypothetical protein
MVRNPWDRIVSTYEYARQNPQSINHALAVEAGSFPEFVERCSVRPIQEHAFDEHGKPLVDRIVRLEGIAEYWRQILRQVSLPFTPLPHVNRSRRRPYQDYYDAATRELVQRRFVADIEIGKYVF